MYYLKLGTLTPSPGIYVQDTDGYCLTADEWNKAVGVTLNGIAVVTENCSFVIDVESDRYSSYASSDVGDVLVDGVTTGDGSVARNDFNGRENTNAILNYEGYFPAVEYICDNYTFPNGKKGYLGAAGEWMAVLDNLDSINELLINLGYNALGNQFWTSTQCNATTAWAIFFNSGGLFNYDKTASLYVRPFASIQ